MSTSFKGLTITVGADTKQFNKEMRAVDRSIRGTNRQVNELQKGLELEFDAGRFAEAQRLAQRAIQDTEMKAQALRDQLKYLEETGGDTQSAQYKKLQTELLKAENQAVLLKDKLEQIKNMKIEALAKQFEKVGKGITKAGQALTPFSAAAAGAVAGLGAMGLSAAKTGGELDDLAMQMGMTAEAYQKLSYVAAQTGADIGRVERAFVLLRDSMGKAMLGETNKSTDALQRLGFTFEEIQKSSPDEMFYEVVKRLASMEDQTLQAAYATEIFNQRVAHDILPLLRSGANAVEELTAEFETLGYLTNEQVSRLAIFDDSLLRIRTALGAIKDQIGAALLPTMEAFAAFMETKVIPAVRKASEWFVNLTDSQQRTLLGTLAFVAALAPALIIIGKLTTGIGGMVKAVGGLSKALTFLSAHPIIAVIGLVAALITLLYTKNEAFKASIDNLVSTLGTALMPILSTIGGLFGTLLNAVMPLLDVLAQALVPIIDMLAAALVPVVNLIASMLVPYFEKLSPILEKVVGVITKIATVIISYLVPVITKLGEIFTSVFNAIPGVINGIIKFIEKAVNSVIDFINGIIQQINKLGSVLGFTIGELNRVKLDAEFGKFEPPKTTTSKVPETANVNEAISTSPVTTAPNYITNNDYSNKDINIQVVVENYAEQVDVDDMVRQINLKLAESL